jgi:chromate reductase
MRVLGISGSLRHGSFNTALLRHAGELFEAECTEFEIYDGLRDLPAYDEDFDVREAPNAVARIRATVRESDAVLFATPEYNSSIPGVLKNAVDWLSRPSLAECALRGKPVAVVGASIGAFGAVWAQAELRKVLGATGARVIEGEVALGRAMDRFDADGRLNDESHADEVREIVDELLAEAHPTDSRKRCVTRRRTRV